MRANEGVPENFQELYYGGKCLKDDGSLVDYGIRENSTLHLVLQSSDVVKIIVNISSQQKNIEIEAKSHDTVENIKMMIQAKEGINSDKCTLLYAGKQLENGRTLSSLGIKDKTTLCLVFNPIEMVTTSVKLPAGEIVKIEVRMLFTVRNVKEIVGSMFGLPARDHKLVHGGKQLADSLTLASYNINEESILEILPALGFQIYIKFLTGNIITLDVCQQDTVSCVKSKIAQKERGWNKSQMRLIYSGNELEDDQDLAQLGVENFSSFHMVYRLVTSIRSMKLAEIKGAGRLPGSTTIGHLKLLIKRQLKKTLKEVCLGGQALQDDKTMADYGLQKDTELTVTTM